jgi:hypothetical protein
LIYNTESLSELVQEQRLSTIVLYMINKTIRNQFSRALYEHDSLVQYVISTWLCPNLVHLVYLRIHPSHLRSIRAIEISLSALLPSYIVPLQLPPSYASFQFSSETPVLLTIQSPTRQAWLSATAVSIDMFHDMHVDHAFLWVRCTYRRAPMYEPCYCILYISSFFYRYCNYMKT